MKDIFKIKQIIYQNKLSRFCALLIICAIFSIGLTMGAQNSSNLSSLKNKKETIQKDIKKINNLLFTNKKKKKSTLNEIQNLNLKINSREKLLKAINNELGELIKISKSYSADIKSLERVTKKLKLNYAENIRNSYKITSDNSLLNYILGSESINQAILRVSFLNKVRKSRVDKINMIRKNVDLLNISKDSLLLIINEKEVLVSSNKNEKQKLNKERKDFKHMISKIDGNNKSYLSELKNKQKAERDLEKTIDKLIRIELASSKANASNKNLEILAGKFEKNKGNLPWPVEDGLVKGKFGIQKFSERHKNLSVNNVGVNIVTKTGSKARSIFEGQVVAVQVIKGITKLVIVKHGDYFTTYKNLSSVYVKKGDSVKTDQEIGVIATNDFTNETVLKFSLWENQKKLNPAHWIKNM